MFLQAVNDGLLSQRPEVSSPDKHKTKGTTRVTYCRLDEWADQEGLVAITPLHLRLCMLCTGHLYCFTFTDCDKNEIVPRRLPVCVYTSPVYKIQFAF
jgi:hypothetical protein